MFVTSTTLSQHETETTTVSLWWSFYCNIICSVLSPRTPFSLLTCRSDFSSLPLPPTRSPSSFFFSVSPLRTQICRLKVRLTPGGGNWPTCSPSTHFKRREDHSATCTGNPFSFLCARPLLMTPTDSEGCTVLSLWIETRDSFWYQRMNRCADAPPPLETLISPPLLWGAVQCWQSCLEPNLHDCFTSCLPSCYGLWSSRWHEVAPCSYYWYQSPWKEKITLADESWLASESQRRDSFDSHENPRTHFQQTCKNTLRFPLFFDAGKRRGFNLPSVWIWKRCFMELSDAHSSALACLLLEVLGPGWTKE